MDESELSQSAGSLRDRQGAIAEAWYGTISRTSFAPFSPSELRARFFELAGEAIALASAEPFSADRAQTITAALAGLHYAQPEALGRTQNLLATEFLVGLSPDQASTLRLRLAQLLEAIATGFCREATTTLLREQESVRRALPAALWAGKHELRAARDTLKKQVEARTDELRESVSQ